MHIRFRDRRLFNFRTVAARALRAGAELTTLGAELTTFYGEDFANWGE